MTWKRAYRWVSSRATWAVMSSQVAAGGARYSKCRREWSRLKPGEEGKQAEALAEAPLSKYCHPSPWPQVPTRSVAASHL